MFDFNSDLFALDITIYKGQKFVFKGFVYEFIRKVMLYPEHRKRFFKNKEWESSVKCLGNFDYDLYFSQIEESTNVEKEMDDGFFLKYEHKEEIFDTSVKIEFKEGQMFTYYGRLFEIWNDTVVCDVNEIVDICSSDLGHTTGYFYHYFEHEVDDKLREMMKEKGITENDNFVRRIPQDFKKDKAAQ